MNVACELSFKDLPIQKCDHWVNILSPAMLCAATRSLQKQQALTDNHYGYVSLSVTIMLNVSIIIYYLVCPPPLITYVDKLHVCVCYIKFMHRCGPFLLWSQCQLRYRQRRQQPMYSLSQTMRAWVLDQRVIFISLIDFMIHSHDTMKSFLFVGYLLSCILWEGESTN